MVRMHPEPCGKQVSPCATVQISMRVAGRLMQLERLDHAVSEVQYQGNQASLPPDIVDLIRRYQQVRCCFSTPQLASYGFYLGRHSVSGSSSRP